MAAVLLLGTQGYAQETEEGAESSMTIEDAAGTTNTVPGEGDMDDVITNKKMRAEAGSKSKYSFSTSLGYSGGTVEKPLAEERPNITQGTAATAKALASANVSGRYRMTPTESLSAGIGIRWIAPLETDGVEDYNGDRVDASNPYLSFNKVYSWSGVQSVLSADVTAYTNSNRLDEGYVANLGISQNNIYDIGSTGLGVGLLVAVGNTFYNKTGFYKNDKKGNPYDYEDITSDYSFGAYPFLEYVINDTFNLRTISGVWVYEHIRSESNAMTFEKNVIYQSVGLGISMGRNFYLYPNVQFIPEDIRADRTNVALSATINLF